jgi:sorting nexin-25
MSSINLLHECWDRVPLSKRIYLGSSIVGVVALVFVAPWIGVGLMRLLIRICLLLFGFIVGVLIFATRGPRRSTFLRPRRSALTEVLSKQKLSSSQAAVAKQTVLSRSLDRALQEVMENLFRDYVLTWYKKVATDEEGFKAIVMDEAWVAVEKIAHRLRAVDMVKFLTEDVVLKLTLHFQELRNSRHFETRAAGCQSTAFIMHSCVENSAKEVEFLRAAAEILVCTLLPDTDSKCTAMKVLLREVLAFQILQPGIEELCDPDYINQTLLSYMEYKESVTEQTRASYAYAETYETFISIIKECAEIEKLQGIRYHIIAEIMQATIIQNLKEAKGIGAEERDAVIGHVKGEVLMNRNLKRYINQVCCFTMNVLSYCD